MSRDVSGEMPTGGSGDNISATDAWNTMMADTWARALSAHAETGVDEEPASSAIDTNNTSIERVTLDRAAVFDQALGELLTAPLLSERGWEINELWARANTLTDKRMQIALNAVTSAE